MDTVASLLWVRTSLGRLAGVSTRPEYGGEAYFVGAARFAAVGSRGLVLHLAPSYATAAMKLGIARPFLSVGAMQKNGWVEFTTQALAPEVAERFLLAAHQTAIQADRRRGRKRPARRRDRKSPLPTKG